jgi:hypothetical protein
MAEVTCELVRFNPRRAARGVGAAEVRIDGQLLWMTLRDIELNIGDFGPLPGLLDANMAYSGGLEVYASSREPASATTKPDN